MRIEIALNLSAVDSLSPLSQIGSPEMGAEVEIVNKRADKAPKAQPKCGHLIRLGKKCLISLHHSFVETEDYEYVPT